MKDSALRSTLLIALGFSALAAITVRVWLAWLAQDSAGGVPIGLALGYVTLVIATVGLGIATLIICLTDLARTAASRGLRTGLTLGSYASGALSLAALVATVARSITGPGTGFLAAGMSHPFPLTLWVLALVTLWVTLALSALVLRRRRTDHA